MAFSKNGRSLSTQENAKNASPTWESARERRKRRRPANSTRLSRQLQSARDRLLLLNTLASIEHVLKEESIVIEREDDLNKQIDLQSQLKEAKHEEKKAQRKNTAAAFAVLATKYHPAKPSYDHLKPENVVKGPSTTSGPISTTSEDAPIAPASKTEEADPKVSVRMTN
ncbi:hypothetical protein CRE_24979 [Caenorhabditis remanei]|uniref:Uncharacterized protein n=1 Tax=Caenorhabditis remanei TaxID=31234 RepID=E3MHR0_CAERE|nr:hypothetical protein CRE_24979 [Caenorhabditis remanei]